MTVKARVMNWSRGVQWGAFWKEKPLFAKAVSLAAQFLLGFLGGSVSIFGECGPFGLALAGRCGCGARSARPGRRP